MSSQPLPVILPLTPVRPPDDEQQPALVRGLRLIGFEPGLPEHVSPETLAADTEVIEESHCPNCGARRRKPQPFHRGRAFKLIVICPTCETAEEF